MFRHVLILKLNNKSDSKLLKNKFLELKENIKEVIHVDVRENCYLKRETNYDVYVELNFKNENDFEKYLVDECHVDFVDKYITKLVKEKIAIDYL